MRVRIANSASRTSSLLAKQVMDSSVFTQMSRNRVGGFLRESLRHGSEETDEVVSGQVVAAGTCCAEKWGYTSHVLAFARVSGSTEHTSQLLINS